MAKENAAINMFDSQLNSFTTIERGGNFMHYFERIAKESADELFQKKMGYKSYQEILYRLGEENFDHFVELFYNDSELLAINLMKWAVTPRTILGLLGYYLDTRGVEYEKDGNGYRVWEEDGYSVYEMLFRVDEKNRKITLTQDLETPVPEDRKRIVSRFLAKINDKTLYNKEVKLGIHNGHVRWETSYTVKNDITDDSMPSDVMLGFTVTAMIDLLVEAFQTMYSALMAVFYEGKSADAAINIMMDELHPLAWVLLHVNRR